MTCNWLGTWRTMWVYFLNFGIKIADGSPDQALHDPEVIRAYIGG